MPIKSDGLNLAAAFDFRVGAAVTQLLPALGIELQRAQPWGWVVYPLVSQWASMELPCSRMPYNPPCNRITQDSHIL